MNEDLDHAIAVLRAGGVVVYPTDTVYGLGADAFNEAAVKRIYAIKRRPADQPLSMLIAGPEDAERLIASFPPAARALAKRFWPGALTIVLQRRSDVPSWISGGRETIGVRVPDHPLALRLIRGLGRPLIGTSANLSGAPSCTTAAEVRRQLGDAVAYILDGGTCPGGVESTVVDAAGKRPVILREGAIGAGEIVSVWESAAGRASEAAE